MSETLRDLVVSLSLNSDNFTRNIKSINKQIQEAESAFRLASAGVENFETTTAGLSSKLSALQRTFQLQQDAVGQYERALQQASDKLQECYTRQNDYAQRLADAKDKQQQLKTEVASAAQAYKHYKTTLGETDSATIAAKENLDAYKGEYRAAVQEVRKLEGQNVALKKSTQNAADAFSAAQTKLNGAKGSVKETAAEIDQCSRQLDLSRTSWASAGEAIQLSQRSMRSGLPKLSRTLPGTEFLAAIMAASAAFPASAAVYYMRVLRMISSFYTIPGGIMETDGPYGGWIWLDEENGVWGYADYVLENWDSVEAWRAGQATTRDSWGNSS